MLVGSGLAERIRSTMGFPLPLSTQLIGWGTGLVTEITTNGVVTNAPGTITGTCLPAPSPLTLGAGSGGLISGIMGSSMAASIAADAGYGSVSTELQKFADAIAAHIISMGTVTFASGDITGVCTNTPISPGVLTAGAGMNGTISGLDGTILANTIHASVGYPGSVSSQLINFCTAIVGYIMDNAQVSYTSGNVVGVCPAGGGSLTAGAGTGGTIA